MKSIYLIIALLFCFETSFSKSLDDEKTKFKKIWKMQEMYLDSIQAPVDSVMQNYRLILANDSICYLHDGTQPILCYWDFNTSTSSINLYAEDDMASAGLFLTYKIIYINEQNLIVTVDLSSYNLPSKLVEYRLIPDASYTFH